MQAADLGDDGVVLRRVNDFDRLHVLVDDRHELRRGDTDGRCEELRRFRLIMSFGLQVVAHRVQARQPLAYIICRLSLRLECGEQFGNTVVDNIKLARLLWLGLRCLRRLTLTVDAFAVCSWEQRHGAVSRHLLHGDVVKRIDDAPRDLRHHACGHLLVLRSVWSVRLLYGHICRRHRLELIHNFLLTNTGRHNAAPGITVA